MARRRTVRLCRLQGLVARLRRVVAAVSVVVLVRIATDVRLPALSHLFPNRREFVLDLVVRSQSLEFVVEVLVVVEDAAFFQFFECRRPRLAFVDLVGRGLGVAASVT
jgi:hypothetical protein